MNSIRAFSLSKDGISVKMNLLKQEDRFMGREGGRKDGFKNRKTAALYFYCDRIRDTVLVRAFDVVGKFKPVGAERVSLYTDVISRDGGYVRVSFDPQGR